MTLTEFVTARLDEDEARARDLDRWPLQNNLFIGYTDEDGTSSLGEYDPARVLREVEAKRAILDECTNAVITGVAFPDEAGPESAALILSLLAGIWSDHPDYDPKWKQR